MCQSAYAAQISPEFDLIAALVVALLLVGDIGSSVTWQSFGFELQNLQTASTSALLFKCCH